jgi:signal transduction histidine kinase
VAAFLGVTVCVRAVFRWRSQYSRTLLEQTQSVAQALRQHRRLAGTLFHDVSNQLQTMVFYLDGDEAADPVALTSLARRVRSLIRLSKEFLVGTGQQPVSLESCRLQDAARALAEAFGPRLRAKATRFEAERGLELSVLAQPELLVESVLGNLLSNAIKFAPSGSSVTLSAEQVGAEVRVSLRDQGPGLSPELARAVGRDAPLPSQRGTAGEQGQGYGLQLVREHVMRMGGRLELNNRAEGGTEASVWLPLATAGACST